MSDALATVCPISERPVFFAGEESASLAGVMTYPVIRPLGAGVVVLPGGGFGGSSRNGLTVRICRELAGLGFHTIRFDWHGVGDSEGVVDRFRVERPFVDDALGAVAELADVGVDRFLFFGSCFGARTALAAAPLVPNVVAMLLVAPPLRRQADNSAVRLATNWGWRDVVRKGLRPSVLWSLRDARRRRTAVRFAMAKAQLVRREETGVGEEVMRGEAFARSLAQVVEEGVDLTFLYGERDTYYADLVEGANALGHLLKCSNVHIEVSPGELHRYQRVDVQAIVWNRVSTWGEDIARRLAPSACPTQPTTAQVTEADE